MSVDTQTSGNIPTLSESFRTAWKGLSEVHDPIKVTSGQEIAPNVRIWFDTELGEQSVVCQAERGGGLVIKTHVERPGRWLGLHVSLGECDLSNVGILGYFARSHSVRALSWRACLRSHGPDGFSDHFFSKHGVSYAAPDAFNDVMEIERQSRLPLRTSYREFILFFHVESFELTLRDLRLFCA